MNNEVNGITYMVESNIKILNDLMKSEKEQIELLQSLQNIDKTKNKKIDSIDDENVINVFSRGIAESLVVDYGHFDKLINIKENKKRKNSLVYVFKKTEEAEKDFKAILEEVKKQKVEREKQNKEIDKAIQKDKDKENEKKEVKNDEG